MARAGRRCCAIAAGAQRLLLHLPQMTAAANSGAQARWHEALAAQ